MPSQGVGYHQKRKIPDPAGKAIPSDAPAVLLRHTLAEQRAQGVSFPEAWAQALPAALELTKGRNDRNQWKCALVSTRHAWRESFLGVGPSRRLGGPVPVDEQPTTRTDVLILG